MLYEFQVQIEETPSGTFLQLGPPQGAISNGASPHESDTPSPGSPHRGTAFTNLGMPHVSAEGQHHQHQAALHTAIAEPAVAQLTQLTSHISYTGGLDPAGVTGTIPR